MLFLVFGYFTQSFLEIRKVKPVRVAIERITDSAAESETSSESDEVMGTEKKEASGQ